jgi:hypothetical protein
MEKIILALQFLIDLVTLGGSYYMRKKAAKDGGRRKTDKEEDFNK